MAIDFTKLHEIFQIPSADYTLERVIHGHINITFRVNEHGSPRFILQRLNTEVFTDIGHLMANYRLVSNTLSEYRWPSGFHLSSPELINTRDGKTFYLSPDKSYWRLLTYIEGADCSAVPNNADTAYQGGLAFGTFLKGLSDINPERLYEIIPGFHSLKRRYGEFLKSLESGASERRSLAEGEITFVKSRITSLMKIPDYMDSGAIPLRVVHNDTKLSNVIFSADGTFRGVIDLDTVMSGSALFDFGDAIRSSANSACEDEPDLSKVKFEICLFDAFSLGYLKTAGSLLKKKETDLLPESALLMTYIIGLRFLTDYLNEDTYFRTAYETHNLVRARVQFRLMEQMETEITGMHSIIEKHRKSIQNKI